MACPAQARTKGTVAASWLGCREPATGLASRRQDAVKISQSIRDTIGRDKLPYG